MKTIDARGLSCPQPVILTQKAFKAGEKPFTVIVDNQVAVDNIKRFASSNKLSPSIKEINGDFNITLG
ncbi:MAG: sulfurtransferase TusA family protein [Oscillospiraceae bacterium]